ncbi:PPE family protein [Nocardia sp. NEAU-G5]|uniref:PPE family protein n=1 Tax=Nocardia albiluteola TaxID=2842303 RepID=A0ABS6B518_9NOCA|nr:PPE domain-containing protein [Nocardia albiluteola]MBU3065403.1 PPE family protein [Nocardia albiluteola]
MVAPPKPGFTGTVWEAVPPEQLVQEVTTGPGAAPMAGAGLAYSGLAAELGEAATEYHATLSVLGDAWASSSSADGLNQLAALTEWLDRITASAHANAAIATRQAAAYEIARTTLPHLVEVAQAARAAEDLMRNSLLGAPLAGLLDTAEQQLDDIRQQAARVMQAYEAASAQLARPWQQDSAPEVSAGANFVAEQSRGTPANAQPPGSTASPPQLQHAMSDLPQIDLSALQPPAPTVPVGSEALAMPALPLPGVAPAPVPAQVVQAQPVTAAPPPVVAPASAVAPPAPLPAPAPRAVPADAGGTETIIVNAGFATAPAVLGGRAPAAAAEVMAPATPELES